MSEIRIDENLEPLEHALGQAEGEPHLQLAAPSVAKPILGTTLFLIAGLLGLLLLSYRVYTAYFVTTAVGKVTIEHMTVTASTSGIVYPTDLPSGHLLEVGETLAVIESVRLPASGEGGGFQAAQRSITSPCRCVLLEVLADEGFFVAAGQSVFLLAEQDAEPMVEATLPITAFKRVTPGTKAVLEVAAQSNPISAVVTSVVVSGQQLVAKVSPRERLSLTTLNTPVQVTIGAIQ